MKEKLYNLIGKSKDNEVYHALQNCRKCYGRGYLGKHKGTEVLIPCSCLKVTGVYDRSDK